MQLAYSLEQGVARAGLLADLGLKDAVSRIADLAVPFGVFVCRDGSDNKAKVPAASADVTSGVGMGVTIATHALESSLSGEPTYPAGATLAVLRKGRIYVKVEEAVVQGDAAFVRFAAGAGGTQLGAFRKSADTATAVALPGAVFLSSAGSGEFAILEVDM